MEETPMFEVNLNEMTAVVFVESELYRVVTASNVGVSPYLVFEGGREYSFEEALKAINRLDSALLSCSKYLYKRIKGLRMQFASAFGPDMMDLVGPAPMGKAA
jgi:hypothetical protein